MYIHYIYIYIYMYIHVYIHVYVRKNGRGSAFFGLVLVSIKHSAAVGFRAPIIIIIVLQQST